MYTVAISFTNPKIRYIHGIERSENLIIKLFYFWFLLPVFLHLFFKAESASFI